MFNHNKETNSFIFSEDEKYKYSDLNEFSNRINKFLKPNLLGVCVCENSIDSVAGYLGFIEKNTPLLLLPSNLSMKLFDYYLEKFKPTYLWINFKPDNEKYETIYRFKNYILFQKTSKVKFQINKKISLLIPTSGSTGSLKLVMLSKKNLLENAKSITSYLKFNSNDIFITNLNYNYSYGLSILNSCLINNSSLILTNFGFFHKEFWELFKQYKVTSISGVPYSFEILKKLKFFNKKFNHLKKITQAGGFLPIDMQKEVFRYCKLNDIEFYVMYGQTEATARISYVPFEKLNDKFGSIGIPIPGGKMSILDSNGEFVKKPYKIGEIIYEGPNVFLGYAKNLNTLKKSLNQIKLLKTGDIGYFDDENFFYIKGRNDRTIKLHGNRINLDELQRKITEITGSKIIVIFNKELIVMTVDKKNVKKINEILKKTFHIHNHRIITIVKFPRLENGKIDYSLLKTNKKI